MIVWGRAPCLLPILDRDGKDRRGDVITRVLAKELGPQNIRVNSINPGVVDTEGARAMETYEQVANAIKAQTPLGRTGMPEDIGLIAAFLASEEARWLTGEIVFGRGGLR